MRRLNVSDKCWHLAVQKQALPSFVIRTAARRMRGRSSQRTWNGPEIPQGPAGGDPVIQLEKTLYSLTRDDLHLASARTEAIPLPAFGTESFREECSMPLSPQADFYFDGDGQKIIPYLHRKPNSPHSLLPHPTPTTTSLLCCYNNTNSISLSLVLECLRII